MASVISGHDLRHGLRVFARNPALTAIAVLSIACGTGANVAMFSVADALLLRPLPVSRPSELVAVGVEVEIMPGFVTSVVSYPEYRDLRAALHSFDGLLAYDYNTVSMSTGPDAPNRFRFASFVSDNFFGVLGVTLPLGRAFHADEATDGSSARVAILSDALWRSDYDADPAAVGRTIRVGGLDFTIVGVAPPSFTGLHAFVREAVFLPIQTLPLVVDSQPDDLLQTRDARTFALKGRLRPGVDLAGARAELATVWRAMEAAYPQTTANRRLMARTELAFKFAERPLDASLVMLLLTLSSAVLLVACANVAGLLASRGPVRAREMALRMAIGADRWRLVRQLLTESLCVAIAGGVLGLVVAQAGIQVLRGIDFPTDMVAPPIFELNGRALTVCLAVAMASALLVGLGPALQTTRVDLSSSLKAGDLAGRRRRMPFRQLLVCIQVALSFVLITVAAFTIQAFTKELRRGPGFRTTNLAMVTIDAAARQDEDGGVSAYFTRLLDEARALPGIRSASVTSAMPLFSNSFTSVVREGEELPDGQSGRPSWASSVDARYFETMAIPLVAGRPFTLHDGVDAPMVAIVNTVLAQHLWPDGDVVNRQVQLIDQGRRHLATIVGVVQPNTQAFPGERPQDAIFFPYPQQPRARMVLLAHTAADSAPVVDPLRRLAQRSDPALTVFDAQTIERFYYVLVTAQFGTMVRMVAGIGVMGVALTMVGLYGLVSYAVSRRTREIGIRMAIGATSGHVVRMVLWQGMVPVGVGVLAGLGLSAATAVFVVGAIPIGHRLEPMLYLLVIPLVVAVAALATGVPARRAARVSPTVALRCE